MLSYSQSVLSAEAERLRHRLEQFYSVDTNRALFLGPLLLDFEHSGRLDVSHTVMDCLDDLLVIYLASEPFQSSGVPCFGLNLKLDAPVWFRYEFFYFFCLINTETQSWCLTRPI